MIKLIKYSFLILGLVAYSQQNIKVTSSSKIKSVKLVTHNPSIKIKKRYKDIKQAKNRTPKELLNSIISENSIEWNRWNNWNQILPNAIVEKQKESFKKMKKSVAVDTTRHFVELIQELYFEYENNQYCWTKSYMHTDFKSKRGYGFYTKTDLMKVEDNRWVSYNRYVDQAILRDKGNFTCFKHELFSQICTKQNPDNNVYMTKLLDKVYEEDTLNLNTLYSEVKRMLDEGKENKTEEYKYFIDEYLF